MVKSTCPYVPNRYFRVMDPEMPICLGCDGRIYEEDEYDMYMLERGFKPFQNPK